MWYYLIPLLVIVYLGMFFISGPIYVRLTEDGSLRENDDSFIGYTIAAVFWPVCLPLCLLFRAVCSTGVLWMKYVKFLESYYKKHHKFRGSIGRDYY